MMRASVRVPAADIAQSPYCLLGADNVGVERKCSFKRYFANPYWRMMSHSILHFPGCVFMAWDIIGTQLGEPGLFAQLVQLPA